MCVGERGQYRPEVGRVVVGWRAVAGGGGCLVTPPLPASLAILYGNKGMSIYHYNKKWVTSSMTGVQPRRKDERRSVRIKTELESVLHTSPRVPFSWRRCFSDATASVAARPVATTSIRRRSTRSNYRPERAFAEVGARKRSRRRTKRWCRYTFFLRLRTAVAVQFEAAAAAAVRCCVLSVTAHPIG